MDRLDKSKYNIFQVDRYAKGFVNIIPFYDIDRRVRDFYRLWSNQTIPRKTYYFTDKTMARASLLDYSHLNSEDFLAINSTKQDKGIVLTSSESGLLNFGYTITSHHIILLVFKGRNNNVGVVFSDGKTADYSQAYASTIGNIVISQGEVTYNASCTMSYLLRMLQDKSFHLVDKDEARRVKRLVKELPSGITVGDFIDLISNFDVEKGRVETPLLAYEVERYRRNEEILEEALRMFLFLKTASVIEQTYICDEPSCTYRRKNSLSQGYIKVDSHWDSDITVLNPFAVRGHFRRQPKKNEQGGMVQGVDIH